MGALFHDLPVLKHVDDVRLFNGGKPVADGDDGTAAVGEKPREDPVLGQRING